MQWCRIYKRLLPGKGYVEIPEFARMRPGDSLEVVGNVQNNVWNAQMVQVVKEVRRLLGSCVRMLIFKIR
jgi:hypothetical protein